jgi:hypothetical protein
VDSIVSAPWTVGNLKTTNVAMVMYSFQVGCIKCRSSPEDMSSGVAPVLFHKQTRVKCTSLVYWCKDENTSSEHAILFA